MLNLTDQCLALPYNERVNLAHLLIDSLKTRPVFDARYSNRAGELLCILENIIGEKLSFDSQRKNCAWAKTMISYQMSQEGFTTLEIGRQMSVKHSTIIHHRDTMQSVLSMPYAYKDMINIWKQFTNQIQNETHRGTDQDSL